jgi:hypothetical protein
MPLAARLAATGRVEPDHGAAWLGRQVRRVPRAADQARSAEVIEKGVVESLPNA